jgi:hypothetical protein
VKHIGEVIALILAVLFAIAMMSPETLGRTAAEVVHGFREVAR